MLFNAQITISRLRRFSAVEINRKACSKQWTYSRGEGKIVLKIYGFRVPIYYSSIHACSFHLSSLESRVLQNCLNFLTVRGIWNFIRIPCPSYRPDQFPSSWCYRVIVVRCCVVCLPVATISLFTNTHYSCRRNIVFFLNEFFKLCFISVGYVFILVL